jgi:hypothetical protein
MLWQLLRVLALATSLSVAMTGPLLAQPEPSEDQDKIYLSEVSLQLFLDIAASPYVMSVQCQIGDREIWRRAVLAVDRRLERCAAVRPEWSAALAVTREKVERTFSVRDSKSTRLAELIFRSLVDLRSRKEIDQEQCRNLRSSPLFRDLLAPGSVSAKERDAAWAAEREKGKTDLLHCEWGQCPEAMLSFRKLGDDQRWVEAPCDHLFPEDK